MKVVVAGMAVVVVTKTVRNHSAHREIYLVPIYEYKMKSKQCYMYVVHYIPPIYM